MLDLHHQIEINASPAKVFAALSSKKGNAGWWTADSKIKAKQGGEAQFGFVKRSTIFTFTIDKIEKGKELVMTCTAGPPDWVGTRLHWNISRDGKATNVAFKHAGWASMNPHCASCNSIWGRLMFRLKDYVESGKPKPQWKK
jgi:uncharacterized protein YndB with AHSA1/START domain